LVTVIVKVTTVPASPATELYCAAVVVAVDAVIVPNPLCVHNIAPLLALAPVTVALLPWQMVWLPPADAVGCWLTVTVLLSVAVNPFPSVNVTE
jgi:hypothetical protein